MQLPKGPVQQAANLSSAFGGRKKKEWGDRAALRSYESWPRRRKADGGQEPPVGLAPSEAELSSYPEAPPGRPRILFRLRRKYDINSGYLADRLT